MKKVFNLSVMLAVLMAMFSFVSCGNKDEEDVLTVSLEKTAIEDGGVVHGKITATKDLASVTLLSVVGNDETTLSGWPVTKFNDFPILQKKDDKTIYDIKIESLLEGKYKLRAVDKNGKEDSKTFTVGVVPSNPEYIVLGESFEAVANKIYGFRHGTLEGAFKITVASKGSVTFIRLNLVNDDLEEIGAPITLSDAGTSYFTTDFKAIGIADARKNPEKVLFLLSKESKTISSGTLALDATIKNGAKSTQFVVFKD